MKNLILSLLTLSLITAICNSSYAQKIVGEGPAVTETVNLKAISSIGLGISANVYLKQGQNQSITIHGQKNIIDLINKDVNNDSWDIKFPKNTNIKTSEKLEIHITLRKIEALNIGGTGSIFAEGKFTNLDDVKLNIGGSGSIKLDLDADEVTCNIGGSGSMELMGEADEVDINIGGSGSVKGLNLQTKMAKVNTAGSGSVTIDVSSDLTATIVGSGGVRYKGNPKIDQTIMGSGRVKPY